MLKKIILSTICATATLTIVEPALASGNATGCQLPPQFAHLCITPPPPPTRIPEPSLLVGGLVVVGGCITRKIAQKKKLASAE